MYGFLSSLVMLDFGAIVNWLFLCQTYDGILATVLALKFKHFSWALKKSFFLSIVIMAHLHFGKFRIQLLGFWEIKRYFVKKPANFTRILLLCKSDCTAILSIK